MEIGKTTLFFPERDHEKTKKKPYSGYPVLGDA
jgi:hypothetical protein